MELSKPVVFYNGQQTSEGEDQNYTALNPYYAIQTQYPITGNGSAVNPLSIEISKKIGNKIRPLNTPEGSVSLAVYKPLQFQMLNYSFSDPNQTHSATRLRNIFASWWINSKGVDVNYTPQDIELYIASASNMAYRSGSGIGELPDMPAPVCNVLTLDYQGIMGHIGDSPLQPLYFQQISYLFDENDGSNPIAYNWAYILFGLNDNTKDPRFDP